MDMRFTTTASDAGTRLDVALARQLQTSRAAARRMLDDGRVTRNGRVMSDRDKGIILNVGDRIVVQDLNPDEQDRIIAQPEMPLTVLAEDATLGALIIDKPAGMPVHPLRPDETGTVMNAVIARYPQVRDIGEGGLRSGVVHRLDVETSGTLAVALTQEAWQTLRHAFAQHQTVKQYQAVIAGSLQRDHGRESLDLIIAQHRPAFVRQAKPGDPPGDVRRCTLDWRVIERLPTATLVAVDLHTGFLHQIRATFAHLGHPVAGDAHYGSDLPAPRPLLHAAGLRVGELEAQAPLPADFTDALQALRRHSLP
jgi:23S rRNA pseudouridine1911/1915/1917 synthase